MQVGGTFMHMRVAQTTHERNKVSQSSTFSPKLAGQNPESISQEAVYHGTLARISARYQVFEKLLWKPSDDGSQRSSWNQMSLTI